MSEKKKLFEHIKVGQQFKYRNVHYLKIEPHIQYSNYGLSHNSRLDWYADVREKAVNCVSLHSGKVFCLYNHTLVTVGDYFNGKRSKRV